MKEAKKLNVNFVPETCRQLFIPNSRALNIQANNNGNPSVLNYSSAYPPYRENNLQVVRQALVQPKAIHTHGFM
jgi:hypothetical protein